jgi:hypothetical protein
MIAKYYLALKPQTDEHHAVHKEGCPFLPEHEKRIYLGTFNSGQDAVVEAKRHFIKTHSCQFCSKDHNSPDKQPELHERIQTALIPAEPEISLSYNTNLLCCLN